MRTTLICVLLSLLAYGQTQKDAVTRGRKLGGCPAYEPLKDFNSLEFSGNWYETFTSDIKRCSQFHFSGDLQPTISRMYMLDQSDKSYQYTVATEPIRRNSTDGILTYYSVPEGLTSNDLKLTNFTILGSDYNNFAVAFECTSIPPFRLEATHVLSRQPILTEDNFNKVIEALSKGGKRDFFGLRVVKQSCGDFTCDGKNRTKCYYKRRKQST